MRHSNATSTTPVTQSVVVSVTNSVYICLITLELASIAIKYQGLTTNPFQECNASMLLFLISAFCHAVVLTVAGTSFPTAILFHVSGVTACEALLWVLAAELLRCTLVNVLMLLIMALIFYHKCICELLIMSFGWIVVSKTCSTRGLEDFDTTDHTADLDAHEGIEIESQVTGLEPVNTM